MATNTVGSSGDYANLAAWETARQGSSDGTETAQLQSQVHTGCTISGWTNATTAIVIEGIAAQDGDPTTGARVTDSQIDWPGPENMLSLTFRDISFVSTGTTRVLSAYDGYNVSDNAQVVTIERCFFLGQTSSNPSILLENSFNGTTTLVTINVDNCVFDGNGADGYALQFNDYGSVVMRDAVTFRGCTFSDSRIVSSGTGSTNTNITVLARGCLFDPYSTNEDLTTSVTTGSWVADSEYCITSDSSATHNANWDTVTGLSAAATFNDSGTPNASGVWYTDGANQDFSLQDNATYNLPIDFVAAGAMPAADMVGETRSTADAGAFEVPAATGATGTSAFTLPLPRLFGIGTDYTPGSTQEAQPTSDTAAGSWTTTPLWSKIDDTEALGDGVEITSDSVGNGSTTTTATFDLPTLTDPEVATGHVLTARWRVDAARNMDAVLALRQGTTEIGRLTATLTGTTETESTYTLSAGEANAITDYSDLNLQLFGTGSGGGPARALVVEKVLFEVPAGLPQITWGLGTFTLPLPTSSATGTAANATKTGTSAITLPLPTSSATGSLTYVGTSAMTLPLPASAASGHLTYTGTSAITLPVPTSAATGVAAHTGTSAWTLPVPTSAATGVAAKAGTSAFTLPVPTSSATGHLTYVGASAFTLPVPTSSSAGVAAHTGASAFTLPVPTSAASGSLTYTGTSAITLPMPTMASSGTATTPGASHTGSGAFTLPLPAVASSGHLTYVGASAWTLPLPTSSAAGHLTYTGTSAWTLPIPTSTASGTATAAGVITSLTTTASTYAVGHQQVGFHLRSSTPVSGAVTDRDAGGQWRIVRPGQGVIHSVDGAMNFEWMGLDGDQLTVRFIDSGGNIGNEVTYTWSVTANTAADHVRYVDNTAGGGAAGTEGDPFATMAEAKTYMETNVTTGQVGVIFVKEGQTHAMASASAWDCGSTTDRMVRIVRWGSVSTIPILSWLDTSDAVNSGTSNYFGGCHLVGLRLQGGSSANNRCINTARGGGTRGQRSAMNLAAIDCEIDGWNDPIGGDDDTSTSANRDDGVGDFIALVGCAITDPEFWVMIGMKYCRHILLLNVSFPTTNSNRGMRVYNWGDHYVYGLTSTSVDNVEVCRIEMDPAATIAGAFRYGTWVNVDKTSTADGGFGIRIAADAASNGIAWVQDLRFINCEFRGGGVTIQADAGKTVAENGNNTVDVTRLDLINCVMSQSVYMAASTNETGGDFHSVRLRECMFANVTGYQGGTLAMTFAGTATRFDDSGFQIDACVGYFPTVGRVDSVYWISALSLTRAQIEAKFLSADYNHVGCVNAETVYWVGNSTANDELAAWVAATTGLDTVSSMTPTTTMDFVNNGVAVQANMNLRMSAGTGPQAAGGIPLPAQIGVDADGYLRDVSTPDAGAYEYGAATLPWMPDVGPPTGTSAFTLPLPTSTAVGHLTYTGTSAWTLPLPVSTAAGVAAHPGTSAMSLPVPTMASSGTATTPSGTHTGTAAFTLPLPTMSSAGAITYIGTSAWVLPLPTMGATGATGILAVVTAGTWSADVAFAAGDEYRIVLTGPAATNPKAVVTLNWRPQ